MLPEEDMISVKGLLVENGYRAKKIIVEFSSKIWSLSSVHRMLRSGAFCKSECTAAGSVTLIIWKNDCLRNGMAPLWPAYHWHSSQPVATVTA